MTPEGRLGFRRVASHDVVPVEHCLLLEPRLDDLHASLDVAWPELIGVDLRAGTEVDDTLILFEAGGDEAPELEIDLPAACALLTRRGLTPLIGEPWVFIEVLGRRYRVSAESFFQVNTVGAAALVEIVAAYADPQPGDVLLDAYCGAGLFALALAELAGEVIGVESSPSACEDFAFNAGDQANISLHEGAVEQVLPALRSEGQRADIVVLDPPAPAPARRSSVNWPRSGRGGWSTSPATPPPWPATPSTWPRPATAWSRRSRWTCSRRRSTWRRWRCGIKSKAPNLLSTSY